MSLVPRETGKQRATRIPLDYYKKADSLIRWRLGLSAQQVWFVSYILSHKWDEDLPYPSLKKLARCSRLSLSQVQRIKNSLCQAGYLKVYTQYAPFFAQLTPEAGAKLRMGNYERLFDQARRKVRAWEKANIKERAQ